MSPDESSQFGKKSAKDLPRPQPMATLMHVILCGLSPAFQHIWNGYAGVPTQDSSTPTMPWTQLQAPRLHLPLGLLPVRVTTLQAASSVHALPLPSTACGVRPMATTSLRSVAICRAPRSGARPAAPTPELAQTRTSHSKPMLQTPHLLSSLVKQVASSPLQTSSLMTTGTRTQEPRAI